MKCRKIHLCLSQVRQFSASSAVRDKLAKPALQIYGIEGRYAHALYSAASKKNSLEKVEADVGKVKVLCPDVFHQFADALFSQYPINS